jgi:hypothetical protein
MKDESRDGREHAALSMGARGNEIGVRKNSVGRSRLKDSAVNEGASVGEAAAFAEQSKIWLFPLLLLFSKPLCDAAAPAKKMLRSAGMSAAKPPNVLRELLSTLSYAGHAINLNGLLASSPGGLPAPSAAAASGFVQCSEKEEKAGREGDRRH